MNDTFDLLWALHLTALGLNLESDEAGRPVLAITAALFERFCVASERWHTLMKLAL